jgi:hypothetical protein
MSGVDFAGRIGRTIAESQPWWPPGPARAGRPNVLVVLFDDVGFADFGCYGSAMPRRPSTRWPRAACA